MYVCTYVSVTLRNVNLHSFALRASSGTHASRALTMEVVNREEWRFLTMEDAEDSAACLLQCTCFAELSFKRSRRLATLRKRKQRSQCTNEAKCMSAKYSAVLGFSTTVCTYRRSMCLSVQVTLTKEWRTFTCDCYSLCHFTACLDNFGLIRCYIAPWVDTNQCVTFYYYTIFLPFRNVVALTTKGIFLCMMGTAYTTVGCWCLPKVIKCILYMDELTWSFCSSL